MGRPLARRDQHVGLATRMRVTPRFILLRCPGSLPAVVQIFRAHSYRSIVRTRSRPVMLSTLARLGLRPRTENPQPSLLPRLWA